MAMVEELENALQSLGLNKYETRIYINLLIRGVATASELSDLSGVPYTRVYDILNSLESKGLVVSIPGRPLRYQALDPEIAFKNLYENERKMLEDKLRELERNIDYVVGLVSKIQPKKGRAEDLIVIKGRTSIYNYILHLIKSASRRVIIVKRADDPALDKELRDKRSEGIRVFEYRMKGEGYILPLLVVIDDKVLIVEERKIKSRRAGHDRAVLVENPELAGFLEDTLCR